MTIVCTCCCIVDDFDDTRTISLAAYDKYGNPCVNYVTYCTKCAERAQKEGRVLNEFMYPEDRGEIFGEPNEEEAWAHHTINEFEQCINKYGAQFVLSRMRNEPFTKLSEWFYDTTNNGEQERAWLLSKPC